MTNSPEKYNEDTIKSLDWREHIRIRPGMYIGKIGDGSSLDDGIYILLKEIIDNSIDEHIMGYGKKIDIKISKNIVSVRDYGRGIPLGKLADCVSKINTGGKYDTDVFQKSVGLNGVGTKAVNALSKLFKIQSIRDNKSLSLEYSKGLIVNEGNIISTTSKNGTKTVFLPDDEIFKEFNFIDNYVKEQLLYYVYLNSGLKINYNNNLLWSENGLKGLIQNNTNNQYLHYPIIHLKDKDIEIAFTHGNQYGEEYYSFVNGQNTIHGGTHLSSFKEAVVKTLRDFYKKEFNTSDIRASIIGAISIRMQNPIFESQTKTKLGSTDLNDKITVRIFINDFIKNYLDNFLHKNSDLAELLLNRIMQSQKERKDMAGIKKIANQRVKKANLHNKKLRDCKVHYSDKKVDSSIKNETSVFITEGDSASGSITKSRNVQNQAVFSLRGKPLNSFGLTKKIVYENEEFNLLQHALNIEDGVDNLRYNKIIIATDADVDGMHIRLLILTFFLQFFPEIVRNGHVYILETPLFRIRNKTKTIYAYSENEKKEALKSLGNMSEMTRFKGLGEISPNEFKNFIGDDMKIEPVIYRGKSSIKDILSYYMGKNTLERQVFIIDNLKFEDKKYDQ